MVKTRAKFEGHADRLSSDQLENGRDHEHVSRYKRRKRTLANHGDEHVEKESTHKRKHKKTRQSLRQKEKRQKGECSFTKKPLNKHNASSGSDEEEERKDHDEEETAEIEVPKPVNHSSSSENKNRPRRRSGGDKNASVEPQEDSMDEESECESEYKNEDSDANKNHVPRKHKKDSSDTKKRHSMKKYKKKQKISRNFSSGDGLMDRKLRSSRRNERNSEGGKKEQLSENDQIDMYTIVKRQRKTVKRDMYGMPVLDKEVERESRRKDDFIREDDEADEDEDHETREGDEEEEEPEEEESSEDSENSGSDGSSTVDRSYNLRKHRKPTNFYMKPQLEALQKWSLRRKERQREALLGIALESCNNSCSEEEEDNDAVFDRARNRNIRKKFIPINIRDSHLNVAGDAEQSLVIDKSVNFSSIGGLDRHLMSLKEMVVFPFLYPEFFQRFKIRAPKGVLFYGPPGTGKTLVARALANECSQGERKVAFFLRKGSDCLSKWVGESEKQIRILFDQAHQMKPSIIFFDEIDGLIPVRSGKQDQVHNSIVSTLLALMDGLDDRGDVMVIGSTNRIDSIDPAFRRPGRFDRELLFPLPTKEGREQILRICIRDWSPGLPDHVVEDLASNTNGYSGADLKGLCTEAALIALTRRYPQIFFSKEKLAINVQEINISIDDFALAMRRIVPSARRSFAPVAKILPRLVRPLLDDKLKNIGRRLDDIFPAEPLQAMFNLTVKEGMPDIPYEYRQRGGAFVSSDNIKMPYSFGNFPNLPPIYRPRFLITGRPSQGQTLYLCPAVLHRYEGLSVHVVDLTSTYSSEIKSSVETLCHTLQQWKNCVPSILYMPNVNLWWSKVDEVATSVLTSSLEDLDPTMPLLILASSSVPYEETLPEIRAIFDHYYEVDQITRQERKNFFNDVILKMPFVKPVRIKKRVLEELPVAPPPKCPVLSGEELEQVRRYEDGVLRRWRRFLRSTINKLNGRKDFAEFRKPVKESEVPDYYDIVSCPMDLSTMMSKVDLNRYKGAQEFLDDINLIHNNALEYNPVGDPKSLKIRRQVRHFKDFAYNLMDETLDTDLERLCQNVHKERLSRGENIEQLEIQEFNIVTSKDVARNESTSETKDDDVEAESGDEVEGSSGSKTRSKDGKVKASKSLEEELEMESRKNKKRKFSSERNDRKRLQNSSDLEEENEPPNKKAKNRSSSSSSSSAPTPLKSRSASPDPEKTPPISSDEDETCADLPSDAAKEEERPENAENVDEEDTDNEEEEEEEEEAEPPILVDENELKNIFAIVVNGTSSSSVDELIGIHSAFERVIFVHKDDYNKAALLEDMRKLSLGLPKGQKTNRASTGVSQNA